MTRLVLVIHLPKVRVGIMGDGLQERGLAMTEIRNKKRPP